MSEETVYNVEIDDKEAFMNCGACRAEFTYYEKADDFHQNTTCPWCGEKLHVPRQKLRRSMVRRNR